MFMLFDRGFLKLVHSETLQSITTSKGGARIFFRAHLDFLRVLVAYEFEHVCHLDKHF